MIGTTDLHNGDSPEEERENTTKTGFRGRGLAIVGTVILALGWVLIGPGGVGAGHNHGAEANAAGTCLVGAVKPMTRTYYIAADLVQWNYAPDGTNVAQGRAFNAEENVFVGSGAGRIGSTYTKALYREYTDATFTTLKPRPVEDAYLGILGPTIRAQVGDTYAGLIGPMIITKAGCAAADGHPLDVDREIINLYQVWNENKSLYLDQNMAAMTPDATLANADLKADPGFEESNLMHAINGYVYTNGPKPAMKAKTKVRWYVFSMGTEVDLHTPHVHGNVWTNSMGMNMDMFGELPGEMQTLNMVPDAPGLWLMHCHVNDHIAAGMISQYQVN